MTAKARMYGKAGQGRKKKGKRKEIMQDRASLFFSFTFWVWLFNSSVNQSIHFTIHNPQAVVLTNTNFSAKTLCYVEKA